MTEGGLTPRPHAVQPLHVGGLAQLLEGALADLADPFAGDAEQLADALEGQGVGALFEAVVEVEDLAFAGGEILVEEPVDELAGEPGVGLLLDVGTTGAREPLAECAGAAVAPLDRRVERQLTGTHSTGQPHVFDRVVERGGHLAVGRLAAHFLGQEALRAGHLDQGRILVERDAHAAGLLGERLEDRLADPPDRVRDELDAVVRVELADRLEQSLVADGHQLGQVEPVPLVLLHVGDHEPEIGSDQALRGLFVAGLCQPRQSLLLRGVGDHRELLDVVEVLVEGPCRDGAKQGLCLGGTTVSHGDPRGSWRERKRWSCWRSERREACRRVCEYRTRLETGQAKKSFHITKTTAEMSCGFPPLVAGECGGC